MDVLAEFGAIALAIGVAAAWSIGQRVPARAVIDVARATGSPRACLGFIQFCLQD
jgi:hypothetical protein